MIQTFTTFGALLKYLRRRAGLTQRELGIAAGYSEAHVSRLENGQRLPTPSTVRTVLIPALHLENAPAMSVRLVELAEAAHAGTAASPNGAYTPVLTNLPAQLTSFIGRESEVAEVKHYLSDTRLLTLTGAGGVGKTRLAIEVGLALAGGNQCPQTFTCSEGVWLVELALLTSSRQLPDAIISALGLQTMSHTALAVLIDYLHDKHILLILDNCEHVIDTCAEVSEVLLRACPSLRIMATSREALNIPGEVALAVPPLTPPEAKQLFVDRAQTVQPGFAETEENRAAIEEICWRLDNVPLALELAAARVRTFSVRQIAARLDDVFNLLSGGSRTALPRHQTLRAMIDWSYNLLPDEERALLRGLSVFVGGWALEAAEDIFGAGVLELLDQLVNKSLVIVKEHASRRRYYLLETIRQYAREKLQTVSPDEEKQVRQRHLAYFAGLAHLAQQHFIGGEEEMHWAHKLSREVENLRAALVWAAQTKDWRTGQQMIFDVRSDFWLEHGCANEVLQWIETAVLSNPEASDVVRTYALYFKGFRLASIGDMVGSYPWYLQASTLAHQIRNEELIAFVDDNLGYVTPDYDQAVARLQQVIQWRQQARLEKPEIWSIVHLGERMRLQGETEQAGAMFDKAVMLARDTGNGNTLAHCLHRWGQLLIERGDYAQARKVLEESAAIRRLRGPSTQFMITLIDLGTVGLYLGDIALARNTLREAIPFQYKLDNMERVAQGLVLAASIAQLNGARVQAARLLGAVDAIRRDYCTHGVFERELFAEYERRLPEVRGGMKAAAFDRAWAEGQQLSIKEAIAQAMEV
jgi:predicted ATPase/DNA-binding XRE family transcriptional regulator